MNLVRNPRMKKTILLTVILLNTLFSLRAQSILSVSPNSGTIGQTLSLILQGSKTHFLQAGNNYVSFGFLSGTSGINFVSVIDDSSLIVNVSIPNTVKTDDYDIIVYNSIDGNILAYNSFFVSGVSHPRIVSVSPAIGSKGQTLNVRVNGSDTHFKTSSLMAVYFGFAQNKTAVNTMSVLNDTVVDLNVTIPPNTITGFYDVSFFNSLDSSISKLNIFYVNGMPRPKILSVSPAIGNAGQTLNVSITGTNTHFLQAPTMAYFGFLQAGNNVNSVNVVNDSLLIANVTIPSSVVTGTYDVSTNDSIDRYVTQYNAFYVNGVPAPIITSITPAVGSAGETIDITIKGANTHFFQGFTTNVYFVQGNRSLITNYFNKIDDTTLTVNLSIPPLTPQGKYNLYIFNFTDKAIQMPDAFLVDGYYGIHEFDNAYQPYQIYPNPFQSQVFIDYQLDKESDVLIELYDVTGKKIFTVENQKKYPGQYQSLFSGDDLKAGFYMIRMELDHTPYYYKLVKQ